MRETDETQKKTVPAFLKPVAIALILLVVGGVAGGMIVNSTLQNKITAAHDEAQEKINEAKAAENRRITASMNANDERQEELDGRAQELAELEQALSTREAALTDAEIEKKNNEFQGGMHTVGTTVSAGTYTANIAGGMCYYAWKTGTGSDSEIIDNNIVDSGLATVTLNDGEFFESKGCGTWTKQ